MTFFVKFVLICSGFDFQSLDFHFIFNSILLNKPSFNSATLVTGCTIMLHVFIWFQSWWTHPVPEHVGGVAPTVLVMLLTAAVRNYFLLQGIMPVCVRNDPTALPLSRTHTCLVKTLIQQMRGHAWNRMYFHHLWLLMSH